MPNIPDGRKSVSQGAPAMTGEGCPVTHRRQADQRAGHLRSRAAEGAGGRPHAPERESHALRRKDLVRAN